MQKLAGECASPRTLKYKSELTMKHPEAVLHNAKKLPSATRAA